MMILDWTSHLNSDILSITPLISLASGLEDLQVTGFCLSRQFISHAK